MERKPMKHLQELHLQHNLTQIRLQIEVGIDQSHLSKYEKGTRAPTVENLTILADFFNTSLDYLMDRTSVREPYPGNQEK